MSRSTLPTSCHAPGGSAFHRPTRSIHGIPRPGFLLPEGDDHDDAGDGDANGGQGGQQQQPDRGFPAGTPVAEMTTEQQVAYWRHYARQHEERANARGDYDTIRAELDQLRSSQMTEQQRAVAEAENTARQEGRQEALREANTAAVRAILDASLQARGRTPDQVTAMLQHTNFESFVTDGAPDTGAILGHVDSIAGPVTGGGPTRSGPDHGQGQRGPQGTNKGLDAGAQMYAQRHGART